MAPLSIAVIGAGPSGLFFCHAIEHLRRAKGLWDPDGTAKVTCFEKSSQPGGVWQAAAEDDDISNNNNDDGTMTPVDDDSNAPTSTTTAKVQTTNMYKELWTNGASHLTEFFDHTYDQHFGGQPVPVYMPRQDLLDYILGRVTKHCPNFLERYVQFRTRVEHVAYDDHKKKFAVTTTTTNNNNTKTQYFDKCVWACGENGRRTMPPALVDIFSQGDFLGRVIHSSETSSLERDVRNKRILIVGGGFSSEDLALQAIKLGVTKVYVSCRNNSTEICWTRKWPMKKVEVLRTQIPYKVTENGQCIQFRGVSWTPRGYTRYDKVLTELRGIDTVILATGYHINMDFLDPSLRRGFPKSDWPSGQTLTLPADWEMAPNRLTAYTGDVPVANNNTVPYGYPCYVHPELYHGVLIDNPGMMFISTYGSHVPLMSCDVYAWLLAGFATGHVPLPSCNEMRSRNEQQARKMMHVPYFRYLLDDNYWKKVDGLKNFWPADPTKGKCKVWSQVEGEEHEISIKQLAGVMTEGKYPFSIGTKEQLNDKGRAILRLGDLDYQHRDNLSFATSDEAMWKTFRDVEDSDQFYSLFTGTQAAPPKQRWLDHTTGTKPATANSGVKIIA